jgi:hypothetical protein
MTNFLFPFLFFVQSQEGLKLKFSFRTFAKIVAKFSSAFSQYHFFRVQEIMSKKRYNAHVSFEKFALVLQKCEIFIFAIMFAETERVQ